MSEKSTKNAANNMVDLIRELIQQELIKEDNTATCRIMACNSDGSYDINVLPDMVTVIRSVKSISPENLKQGDYAYIFKFKNKLNNAVIIAKIGGLGSDVRFLTAKDKDGNTVNISGGPFLPLTGGTLTGNLDVTPDSTSSHKHVKVNAPSGSAYAELSTFAGSSTTRARLTLNDGSGSPTEYRTKEIKIGDYTLSFPVLSANKTIATTDYVSGVNDGTNWTSITINGVTKSIPTGGSTDNQRIKAGSTTFGDNDVIDIVAGANISVIGATSGTGAPKITISATDKYHTTGSWSDLTYTATANGGADPLTFTIPTGTTANTVAVGNHTHTLSLASSSGTPAITLGYNQAYQLTAGGSTLIFKMPASDNTDHYHTPTAAGSSGLKIGTAVGTGLADLYVQFATYEQAGLVSTTTQTFAGDKTLYGNLQIDNNVDDDPARIVIGSNYIRGQLVLWDGQDGNYITLQAENTFNNQTLYIPNEATGRTLATREYSEARYVRYDTNAQGLSNTQKEYARTNIGALSLHGGNADGDFILNGAGGETITFALDGLIKLHGYGSGNSGGILISSQSGNSPKYAILKTTNLTADHSFEFPNKDGTLAVTDDIGNGTLSIKGAGTSVATFTANQSGNSSFNIKGDGIVSVTADSTNHEITISATAPNYPVTDVQINGTSIVSNKVANFVTNTAYNASSNKIATMSDVPYIPVTNAANHILLSSQAIGTPYWSNWSTAGVLMTDASGAVSAFSGFQKDSSNGIYLSNLTIGRPGMVGNSTIEREDPPSGRLPTNATFYLPYEGGTLATQTWVEGKGYSVVSGANDGTNWTSITINGTTKAIPNNNDNQTIKGNGTAFGANDVIDIVGSGIVGVTADTTTKKITISASHQSIKTLNTTATTAQTPSASEDIAGSGSITLHKIAKTGTYSDLIGTPDLTAYVTLATAQTISGAKTFSNSIQMNNNAINWKVTDGSSVVHNASISASLSGASDDEIWLNVNSDNVINVTAVEEIRLNGSFVKMGPLSVRYDSTHHAAGFGLDDDGYSISGYYFGGLGESNTVRFQPNASGYGIILPNTSSWSGDRTIATTSDIGNGTLTIQGNGTAASTFTANQSGNTTLNIKGGGITSVTKSADNEITITSTEADTLASVTARGATTSVAVTMSGGLDVTGNNLKLNKISAPTSSGGTTYGPGTNGQVLKSNGSTVYWASDSNTNTWRNIKVDGAEQLSTRTDSGALDFISQDINNGDVTFTYDSNLNGLKARAKIPTALKNPNAIKIQGGGQDVASYDGSAAKTINFAASSTAGAFTISDGTTTRTIQLAGVFTDNNQKVKAGNVTFSDNDTVNFVGSGIVSVTGDASTDTITISASHQSIKSLDTTATTAQSTNSNEAIAGSGKIILHKVAKTGTYSDLIGKPSIPTKDSDLTNDRYVRFDTASQGLTDTQKANARLNINAAAGSHTHDTRYVRFDTNAQGLNDTQKQNARTNIGAGVPVEIVDLTALA